MDGNLLSSPTPFTPPTTEEDRVSWLRLIRSRRVGPSTFARLIAEHGCAIAALDALPAIAQAAGIDHYSPCPADQALREYHAGLKAGARLLCLGAPDYPQALAAISDAPPVLWALGRGHALDQPCLAVVGARNASSLGQRTARDLAEGLGHHGFTVISGLARGIDTIAHGAALKTGTIAVMAGGVDHIYPAENAALAAAIADQIVLLHHGRLVRHGSPADVYDAELLSEVYEIPVDVIVDPATGDPTVLPRPRRSRGQLTNNKDENARVPPHT